MEKDCTYTLRAPCPKCQGIESKKYEEMCACPLLAGKYA